DWSSDVCSSDLRSYPKLESPKLMTPSRTRRSSNGSIIPSSRAFCLIQRSGLMLMPECNSGPRDDFETLDFKVISWRCQGGPDGSCAREGSLQGQRFRHAARRAGPRSEEHTSELQSRENLVCRLLLEKKK